MGFWDDTWLGRAASNVGSAVGSAVSAVADGAVALVDGRAVDAVVDGAKWVNEKAIQPAASWVGENAPKLLEGETWKKAGQGVLDYGKFVIDNPLLAGRQAVQGLSNSVTGLVGFAGDVVIYAGEGIGKGVYNLAAGAVNLGAKDGERYIDYAGMSNFSKLRALAEEYTGDWAGFTRAELDQMVRDGKITEQEANFAAGTKYGFQAVGEVATFVAISAVTAGAGGAALAAARGGAVGMRVAQAGNVIARTGRLGEVVAKPLLWFGNDVKLLRGVPYLEQAASLAAKEAPARSLLSRTLLPGPMRVYQPSQTSHAFASWFGGTSNPTLGYGLRAAEGTFKFLNPLEANGSLFLRNASGALRPNLSGITAWSIEGGGAALSYTMNHAKEYGELEALRANEEGEARSVRDQANDMRRRLGLPVLGDDVILSDEVGAPQTNGGGSPVEIVPQTNGEVDPGADGRPENIRGNFEGNARRDSTVTHKFKINNGLVQPTDLDLTGSGGDSSERNLDPGEPGTRGPNR